MVESLEMREIGFVYNWGIIIHNVNLPFIGGGQQDIVAEPENPRKLRLLSNRLGARKKV